MVSVRSLFFWAGRCNSCNIKTPSVKILKIDKFIKKLIFNAGNDRKTIATTVVVNMRLKKDHLITQNGRCKSKTLLWHGCSQNSEVKQTGWENKEIQTVITKAELSYLDHALIHTAMIKSVTRNREFTGPTPHNVAIVSA